MEEDILRYLVQSRSPDEAPRRQAEGALAQLSAADGFPLALVNIATAESLELASRQAAVVYLRSFIDKRWSASSESELPPLNDETKATLRVSVLNLITNKERKIRSAAAYAVSRMASHDFPEEWPTLLQDLLSNMANATDEQLHGILKVLGDLVEDGFSEQQFFASAPQLVEMLINVVAAPNRPDSLRALALQIFRTCFEILEMVKDTDEESVKDFATKVLDAWVPLFLDILKAPLLELESGEKYNNLIALKLQVVKTLLKVLSVFPSHLTKFMTSLFSATWSELSTAKARYEKDFVIGDANSKSLDVDYLPQSLDLLMLEELDFLQNCLRSKTVKEEFVKALNGTTEPLDQMIHACVCLAQIPSEDEGMWEIDFNIFLGEEASLTPDYGVRNAAADLVNKLVDWLGIGATKSLLNHINHSFSSNQSWKYQEASLLLLDECLSDNGIKAMQQIDEATLTSIGNIIQHSLNSEHDFLRARGYVLVGGLLCLTAGPLYNQIVSLVGQTIQAAVADKSDVVKICCMRSTGQFIEHFDNEIMKQHQPQIISAIANFLGSKDASDLEESQYALAVLVECLRRAIGLSPQVALDPQSHAIEMIFAIATHGASDVMISSTIEDTFDEMTLALSGQFEAYCNAVIPPIVNAIDADDLKNENSFTNLGVTIILILMREAPSPLPSGVIQAVLPRLARCLLQSDESDLLQSGAETLKCMVACDSQNIFQWRDEHGKSGLEVILVIIDRLLKPDIPDQSAAEVGGLAAEIVDKAGNELGSFLMDLLKAVAGRLSTATKPMTIQNLILVFVRLVTARAKDVVDFLSSFTIGESSGLHVVMTAWLENSNIFTGYSEIKQNVVALAQLYALNDPRISAINVQGDQIVTQSNRIMTRAQTKNNPIRYTIIPAPIKIVKLLAMELASAYTSAAVPKEDLTGAQTHEPASDDDEWEDDDALDLGTFAVRQALMSEGENRGVDDETEVYLITFFREISSQNISDFQNIFTQLTPEEQTIIQKTVS